MIVALPGHLPFLVITSLVNRKLIAVRIVGL